MSALSKKIQIHKIIIAYWQLPIACCLLLTACTQTTEIPAETTGYAYFPLAVKDFRIYDVLDSSKAQGGSFVVKRFQVKEEITEKFIDLSGDTTFRVERYKCQACGSVFDPQWQLDSVWTAKLAFSPGKDSYNRAVRAENNIIAVKLVFPVGEGKSWNANQLYGSPDNVLEYKMANVGKPFLQFPQTLLVIQNADTTYNLQKHDKRIEVYAKDLGLAYKDLMYWEFNCDNGCVGRKQINFGKRTITKLTDFGRK